MAGRLLMSDLREIEDLLDLCMARSEDVLTEGEWQEMANLKGSVRVRRGFLGEVLSVALAGATGSGKSSLLNAMCGADVATVGVLRPTTSRSLAAVPKGLNADIASFVDLLAVDDTVVVDHLKDVVVVDLPDMDSRMLQHRSVVEAALQVVDAVVWVLDPEKYADRVIHDEFLSPLSPYHDQFIFCLNKADRLGTHTGVVRESLASHLIADGYPSPQIVMTVAAPEADAVMDIEQLTGALDQRLDQRRTAQRKIAMDVRRFASSYWTILDAGLDRVTGPERDATAVAMATFVSLGIAATQLHHDLTETAGS
jgi:GTP-binding protein EngB required for normal cell division